MIILYALLIWPLVNQNDRPNSWLEILIVAATAIIALIYVILSRHPVTRLLVGPDGIHAPYGLLRQISWHEIESVQYIQKRPLLFPLRRWLVFTLKPETARLSRLPMPTFLDRWRKRKASVRIPVHVLRAPSGEVLASIQRFMPVVETDQKIVETGLKAGIAAPQQFKDSF